jgi:hypothetical protein
MPVEHARLIVETMDLAEGDAILAHASKDRATAAGA